MHVIDLQAACTSILGKKASKMILAQGEPTTLNACLKTIFLLCKPCATTKTYTLKA